MRYSLYKNSSEGWVKRFWILSSLRRELERHVCSPCMIVMAEEEKIRYDLATHIEAIAMLLYTSCGAEFGVSDNVLKKIEKLNV